MTSALWFTHDSSFYVFVVNSTLIPPHLLLGYCLTGLFSVATCLAMVIEGIAKNFCKGCYIQQRSLQLKTTEADQLSWRLAHSYDCGYVCRYSYRYVNSYNQLYAILFIMKIIVKSVELESSKRNSRRFAAPSKLCYPSQQSPKTFPLWPSLLLLAL